MLSAFFPPVAVLNLSYASRTATSMAARFGATGLTFCPKVHSGAETRVVVIKSATRICCRLTLLNMTLASLSTRIVKIETHEPESQPQNLNCLEKLYVNENCKGTAVELKTSKQ